MEGLIKGTKLKILVDFGVDFNFIHNCWAQALEIPIDASRSYEVVVGNGKNLHCRGVCENVPIIVNGVTLQVDLNAFPFMGVNVILGLEW